MYQVGISQRMTARHRLPEGVLGEQDEHAHHYLVEMTVRGVKVDRLGYLMDIDELKTAATEVLDRYRGSLLNELDDFKGRPPSMENLAKAIHVRLAALLPPGTSILSVKVWEDEVAWAGYEQELGV